MTILYQPTDKAWAIELIDDLNDELASLKGKDDSISEAQSNEIRGLIATLTAATSRPILLAENPPDTAKESEFAVSLELTGTQLQSLSPTLRDKVIKLANLDKTNHVLRDTLYRLNEAMVINPKVVTRENFVQVYEKVLDTIVTISDATEDSLGFDPENLKVLINSSLAAHTLKDSSKMREYYVGSSVSDSVLDTFFASLKTSFKNYPVDAIDLTPTEYGYLVGASGASKGDTLYEIVIIDKKMLFTGKFSLKQ